MQGKQTEYGFEWGPVNVERGFCDDHKGWVTLILRTKKYPHGLQVYITKTGKVRIHCAKGEWAPPNASAKGPGGSLPGPA